jgi:hypothetical protein
MKFYAPLTRVPLDAKAQMNVIQGQKTMMAIIAPVQQIVPYIVQPMSMTVRLAKIRKAADCPRTVLRKQEVLTGKYAHSIARKYVKSTKYSVTEE